MEEETNLITIIQEQEEEQYKIVNLTCVQDRSLSWKAKGIHLYLLSRPPNWQIYQNDLISRSTDGQSSLHAGIKELEQAGYVYRTFRKGDINGEKIRSQWGYCVLKTPKAADQIVLQDGWKIYSQQENITPRKSGGDNQGVIFGGYSSNNKTIRIEQEEGNITTSSFRKNLNEEVDGEEASPNPPPQQGSRRIAPTKESLSQLKDIIREGNENSLMPSVVAIIDYWNGLGLARLNHGTKAALSVNSLIRSLRLGTFFDHIDGFQDYRGRKFTDKEIYKSIGNFALAATNYDYSPVNKQFYVKSGMVDFFYNGFRTGDNKSWFIKFLENPPVLLPRKTIRLIDDPNERITEVFKQAYLNKVCGGVEVELTDHQINDLRIACKKALEFYQKNSRKFVDWARRGEIKFVRDVLEALESNIENQHNGDWSKVTTGWFSSDILWNKTLPAWLNKEGLIEQ